MVLIFRDEVLRLFVFGQQSLPRIPQCPCSPKDAPDPRIQVVGGFPLSVFRKQNGRLRNMGCARHCHIRRHLDIESNNLQHTMID